ncbi:hypothetical protein BJX65DRAFT_23030 [Aspergillus insuetus]
MVRRPRLPTDYSLSCHNRILHPLSLIRDSNRDSKQRSTPQTLNSSRSSQDNRPDTFLPTRHHPRQNTSTDKTCTAQPHRLNGPLQGPKSSYFLVGRRKDRHPRRHHGD